MIPGLYFSQIDLGFVTFQVWGLLVSLGFMSALLISLKEARTKNIDSEIIWNLMLLALLGMILGGKLFYIILEFIQNEIWDFSPYSGFSLIGGAIMSSFLCLSYLRRSKQNWRRVLDLLTVGAVAALIFTRIGCLLISDHIGKITNLPWGMLYVDGTVRHPIALYHILSLSVILFLILRVKKHKVSDGFLFFYFCFLYSAFRFIADFFRCVDLPVCDVRFYGFTVTQWILAPVFIFSLAEIRRLSKLSHS